MATRRRRELRAIPRLERATHAVALHLATKTQLAVIQAEAHVLAFLEPVRSAGISDIHRAFGHHRSTLTSVLARLERRGLVTRSVDLENRRNVIVTLTARGRVLAERVFTVLHDFESAALAGIAASDLEAFARVADAIAARGRAARTSP